MVHRPAQDAEVLTMGKKSPRPIYHFTHAKNLSSILSTGYVYCKSQLPDSDEIVNVSHQSVQEKRRNKQVRCHPGGILHDYVPFYFATRSPMMYVISRGGVEGYDSNTKPVIYLVSSIERVQELDLSFAFSDGHPIMALSQFYNDIADLKKVDWEVMEARMWRATEEDPDPDKSRRRQAEFLVHRELPWDAVEYLAVKNRDVKDRLYRHLSENWPEKVKPVKVEPGWYFS